MPLAFTQEDFLVMYCSAANNFLKSLSSENNGRYHQCRSDFDAHKFAHKLLNENFTDLDVSTSKLQFV